MHFDYNNPYEFGQAIKAVVKYKMDTQSRDYSHTAILRLSNYSWNGDVYEQFSHNIGALQNIIDINDFDKFDVTFYYIHNIEDNNCIEVSREAIAEYINNYKEWFFSISDEVVSLEINRVSVAICNAIKYSGIDEFKKNPIGSLSDLDYNWAINSTKELVKGIDYLNEDLNDVQISDVLLRIKYEELDEIAEFCNLMSA